MKRFLSLIIGILYIVLTPSQAQAADPNPVPSCQPIYGGGENCLQTGNITINKTIQNPQTLQYVDNLDSQGIKFTSGQIAEFRLTIQNTSSSQLSKITIKDILPSFIDYDSSEGGQYDTTTKTITFNIDKLNSKETKNLSIKGKIILPTGLSSEQTTFCTINQATANQNDQISQDNAMFCILRNSSSTIQSSNTTTTKGGLPVYPASSSTTTPKTGPEAIALLGLIPTGLLGFLLRKKAH